MTITIPRPQHNVWPEGVPFKLPPIDRTLDDNLRISAQKYPTKTALVFYGAETSYADFDAQASYLAGYLQKTCGVEKGDRVGLYMQNSPQSVISFYAIIRCGAVVVPINAMNLSEETDYIVENANIRVIIAGQELVSNLKPLVESGRLDKVIVATYSDALPSVIPDKIPAEIAAPKIDLPSGFCAWGDVQAAQIVPNKVQLDPEDLAVLPYTSGSTGRGKGCMHTHQSTLHAVDLMINWFAFGESDVFLGAAPMFHVVGLQCGMNMPIALGGTIVLLPRWDRDVAAELIRSYGISAWPTVPTAIIDLLNKPDLKRDDVKTLRVLWGGGTAMPAAMAEKLQSVTGLTFLEGYGMTETMAPASACPPALPKAQCGGVAGLNTDIIIVDPETLELLPLNQVGEILISGPQTLKGYWRNAEADAETFVEIAGQRFVRTGDLGHLDDDGYVFIVDRLKRMINASGYKVWPAEVEAKLYAHPSIAEACIIAARDEYRGETVKAVVVLKPNSTLTRDELASWAKSRMASYKIPKILQIVDQLPKSGSGKILWRQLQEKEKAGE